LDITQWFLDMEAQLHLIRSRALGYFPEQHVIRPPTEPQMLDTLIARSSGPIPVSIIDFYRRCDGIDLPDVHNGYWIHSIETIFRSWEQSVPTKIRFTPEQLKEILVFGRDGGGNYFASWLGSLDEVVFLPNGDVTASVFNGILTPVVHIANTFHEYLARLLKDTEAFVAGTPDHEYMS
jgi:hypothetical protein